MLSYYTLLEVNSRATQKEIKAAYHQLARRYHPDLNPHDPDAEERLKQINAAYEILSDPQARAKYDQDHFFRGREFREQTQYQTHHQTWRDWTSWGSPDWTSERRTRSTGFRHRYPIDEMNRFVFDRLRQRVRRETIVQELCDWIGLDWLQGADFVKYAEIIYRYEMRRLRRQLSRLGAFVCLGSGGFLLNMLAFILERYYSNPPGTWAIVMVSCVLFYGGFFGTARTLSDMMH